MGFLSETLVAASPTVVSAFTECIIVATLSGHTLSHRHQYPIRDIGFNALEAFWAQHQWINVIHNQWMEAFSSKYSADMQQSDPMLLFIGLMYRIITLHLYQTTACIIPAADEEQNDSVIENRTRASLAAKEIVSLIKQLSQLNSFKVGLPLLQSPKPINEYSFTLSRQFPFHFAWSSSSQTMSLAMVLPKSYRISFKPSVA